MNDRDCENCKHHTKKGCKSWDCNFERKVTRKETIKVFEDMKKGLYPFDPTVYLDIAINSLEIDERYELEYEQIEPCEDAISRQAVLDATVKRNSIWNKITNSKGENLEEIILQLPPVTPQPKMGEWIEIEVHNCHATLKCSVCDRVIKPTFTFGGYSYEDIKTFYPYCHCGAKMQEVEDE